MEMEKATRYMRRGRKETVGRTELDGLLVDWVGALLHASSLDCGSMETQWNDSRVRSPRQTDGCCHKARFRIKKVKRYDAKSVPFPLMKPG
jgi:hypothetical protein